MDIIDSMSLKNSNSQEVVDQYKSIEQYALALSLQILHEAVSQSIAVDWNIHCSGQCNQKLCREEYKYSLSWGSKRREEDFLSVPDCGSNLRWTPETPASPSHINYSKCSRRSSLSFSHDSLIGIVPAQDDSHLISGAVSHDTLVFSNEKDSSSDSNSISHRPYFNSDIYSNPFDHVKPYEGTVLQPKVILKQPMKLYPNCYIKSNGGQLKVDTILSDKDYKNKANRFQTKRRESSTVSKNTESKSERIVSESADVKKMNSSDLKLCQKELESNHTNVNKSEHGRLCRIIPFNYNKGRRKKIISEATEKRKSKCLSNNFRQTFCTLFQSKKVINDENNFVNAKNEFINASHCPSNSPESQKWGKLRPLQSAPPLNNSTKDSAFTEPSKQTSNSPGALETSCNSNAEIKNLKSNTFNKKVTQSKQSSSVRSASLLSCLGHSRTDSFDEHCPVLSISELDTSVPQASKSPKEVNARALPPLPSTQDKPELAKDLAETWKPMKYNKFDEGCDFASIIEKVKNYGWYWGPISGEAAEKVLSNEPDGSFIVRDSSDHHYIFSLTFRLNGITRHVRIEHDQGNFSFGGFTRFKSQTIVDFIEKAVEHSRSGRYLFFLHRRPVLGPMRVQLLHPVSRFKHVQSLQHLCRFIIVKRVRKDHLPDLPLPQRLKDYLNSPHYYSEQVEQCMLSSKGGRAKPAERRRRSLRPNARYTPQTSVQNPRRERTFAATLGSEVARANRFAESNQAPLPRTVNFDFSTDCQMSFASFDGRPSVNSQRKLREYHKTSSYSSLESCLNLDVSQDPCATELNNVRRYRRSFASNRQSTLEKSKNSNWNKSYFCKSASDCDLSSTYASDRGDSMNEL